jgi:hypothetical protein
MKNVRSGIDAIGREINVMTDVFTPFRKEIEKITEARKIHRALCDINNDTKKSYEKEHRIDQRIQDIRTRIGECKQELAMLEHDESKGILSEQLRALQIMKEERDNTIRRYSALSMTASHVLHKAEKLAHKQRRKADEAALKRAMDILSDHTVPYTTDLAHTLAAACTITIGMINGGVVSLKNKEERTLFSDPAAFISEIRHLSEEYTKKAKHCDEAEHALRSHPVITRSESLAREKTQLDMILEKEIQSRDDLIKWRDDLHKIIPGLQQNLEKLMGEISGSDVQIQYSLMPAPSPGG